MDGIKDFLEDHAWAKSVAVLLACAVAFCSAYFPLNAQVTDLEAQVAADEVLITANTQTIAANALFIAALDDQLEITNLALDAHKTAYSLYIQANDKAVGANTDAIADFELWLDEFYYDDDSEWVVFLDAWSDFQEEYEAFRDAYYTAWANWGTQMTNWYNELYDLCTEE